MITTLLGGQTTYSPPRKDNIPPQGPSGTERSSRLSVTVSCVCLAIVYFITGKLGLNWAFVHASATAVWPPAGISLAALLLLGYGVWPGVFLGAFLVNITTMGNVLTCLGIASGNTLEALATAWMITRWANGSEAFFNPQSVIKFMIAATFGTMVAATLGPLSLALGGSAQWSQYGSIWFTWWLGDLAGALIVTPFLVLWTKQPRLQFTVAQAVEACFLVLALFLVCRVVFYGWQPTAYKNQPNSFLCWPLLIWVALRFGPRETVTTLSAMSWIALYATLHGEGPFSRGSPNANLVMLEAFLGICNSMALVMAADVSERKKVEEGFQKSQDQLEHNVNARTEALLKVNAILREEMREREKANEMIRLYADIVRNVQAGIVVLHLENRESVKSFRVLAANAAADQAAQAPITSFIGRYAVECLPHLAETHILDNLRQVILLNNPKDLGEVQYVDEVVPEGTFYVKAFPLPKDCVGVSFENITKRKMADRDVQRLAAIVASSDAAIVSTDMEGVVLNWNPGAEKLFGYSANEILGKSMLLLVPPDPEYREEQSSTFATLRLGQSSQYESRRMRKDGTVLDALITASPIKDGRGSIVGFSAFIRDITRRKRIEDDLRQKTTDLAHLNAELNLFASAVSHELQEPVRKIVGFGDMILSGAGSLDPAITDYIDRMKNAAIRMQKLVEGLLTMARATTQTTSVESVNLNEALKDVLSDISNRIEEEGGRVDVGPLPTVTADGLQIRQLFQNLISNSFKFRKKDQPLHVEISSHKLRGKFVEITVKDNGIGFEEEYADRIFKPFQRLHRRTEYEGSGLGLAICKRIVLRISGSIAAKSKPGEGSSFIVTLPT